jgi:hypothetical protein
LRDLIFPIITDSFWNWAEMRFRGPQALWL